MSAGAAKAVELGRRLHHTRVGEQRGAVDPAGRPERRRDGFAERVRHRPRGAVEADSLGFRRQLPDAGGGRGGRVVDAEAVGADVLDRARGPSKRNVGVPDQEH